MHPRHHLEACAPMSTKVRERRGRGRSGQLLRRRGAGGAETLMTEPIREVLELMGFSSERFVVKALDGRRRPIRHLQDPSGAGR